MCVNSDGCWGISQVAHWVWTLADKGRWAQPPPPTCSTRYTTNTTVSNALKIYFWGNYFLNIVEYTGNLQGNDAFKTLFFFLRKGSVYLLCSLFLNNLWTRESP
ncbi:unnamed protein product [Rangifer tarandus platyrhynchus]|uniref:Uncharacterized protein n=2 Tax=Rangifer tarandus platyrhynchus TaxID=3082113 RepID=A0ABN8YYR5_RANTA|nr:unnamed protein product [Rangifer tarandus platyrhynchus]